METLPLEIVHKMSSLICMEDLVSFSSTCRTYRKLLYIQRQKSDSLHSVHRNWRLGLGNRGFVYPVVADDIKEGVESFYITESQDISALTDAVRDSEDDCRIRIVVVEGCTRAMMVEKHKGKVIASSTCMGMLSMAKKADERILCPCYIPCIGNICMKYVMPDSEMEIISMPYIILGIPVTPLLIRLVLVLVSKVLTVEALREIKDIDLAIAEMFLYHADKSGIDKSIDIMSPYIYGLFVDMDRINMGTKNLFDRIVPSDLSRLYAMEKATGELCYRNNMLVEPGEEIGAGKLPTTRKERKDNCVDFLQKLGFKCSKRDSFSSISEFLASVVNGKYIWEKFPDKYKCVSIDGACYSNTVGTVSEIGEKLQVIAHAITKFGLRL